MGTHPRTLWVLSAGGTALSQYVAFATAAFAVPSFLAEGARARYRFAVHYSRSWPTAVTPANTRVFKKPCDTPIPASTRKRRQFVNQPAEFAISSLKPHNLNEMTCVPPSDTHEGRTPIRIVFASRSPSARKRSAAAVRELREACETVVETSHKNLAARKSRILQLLDDACRLKKVRSETAPREKRGYGI
jgi:hypothetical protein